MDIYEIEMIEASEDEEFMKRTIKCQADFEFVDREVDGEW